MALSERESPDDFKQPFDPPSPLPAECFLSQSPEKRPSGLWVSGRDSGETTPGQVVAGRGEGKARPNWRGWPGTSLLFQSACSAVPLQRSGKHDGNKGNGSPWGGEGIKGGGGAFRPDDALCPCARKWGGCSGVPSCFPGSCAYELLWTLRKRLPRAAIK